MGVSSMAIFDEGPPLSSFSDFVRDTVSRRAYDALLEWDANYDREYGDWCNQVGVYIHTRTVRHGHEVVVTFFHYLGEEPAVEFMSSFKGKLRSVLDDSLQSSYSPYRVRSCVTDWEPRLSDIITKCIELHDNGVLVSIGGLCSGMPIAVIENGRRPQF